MAKYRDWETKVKLADKLASGYDVTIKDEKRQMEKLAGYGGYSPN